MKSPFKSLRPLLLFIAVVIALLSAPIDAGAASRINKALRELDKALANRDAYTAQRIEIDDSMKAALSRLNEPQDRFELMLKLSKRYIDFQVDSAIAYAERAHDLTTSMGLPSKAGRIEALTCGFLASQGQLREAMERFAAIDTTGMELYDRLDYLASGSRLYFVASYCYPPGDGFNALVAKGRDYTEQYLRLAPIRSDTAIFMSTLITDISKHPQLIEASLKEILQNRVQTDPFYPLALQQLGSFYLEQNRPEEALEALVHALTAEIINGCRSGESASILAHELIRRGDSSRGHQVLELALENARLSNWRVRAIQAAEITPNVANNLNRAIAVRDTWVFTLLIIAAAAIATIIWLIMRLRTALTTISTMRKRTAEADNERRLYFNRFLKLCAVYLETLEKFTITARRKISTKQVDDLYEMINSGTLFNEQSKKFYEIFDNAFCHAYPRFVEELNKLLLPDKQVIPPSPDTLTTELRILAFMRIGFDESARIASFLSVSVNTIYTYRNRMRARAISRDTFEDDLMKIGL